MSYIDSTDLISYFDKRLLCKLSNDDPTVDPNNTANINSTIVDLYIEDAAYIIANKLRNIYTDIEPNDTPTSEIKMICAQLAYCGLWERRGTEPMQVTELRKRVYERLHKMAIPSTDERRENTNLSKIAVDNRI